MKRGVLLVHLAAGFLFDGHQRSYFPVLPLFDGRFSRGRYADRKRPSRQGLKGGSSVDGLSVVI